MTRLRLTLLVALTAGIAGCQVSVATGVIGGLIALGAGLAFILLGGSSQAGCNSGPLGPCLSIAPPPDPDARVPDARVPDARVRDAWAGPCLSVPIEPPPPESAPPPAPSTREIDIGPCLKGPDPGDEGAFNVPKTLDQSAVLARVLEKLPADVVARLRKGDGT